MYQHKIMQIHCTDQVLYSYCSTLPYTTTVNSLQLYCRVYTPPATPSLRISARRGYVNGEAEGGRDSQPAGWGGKAIQITVGLPYNHCGASVGRGGRSREGRRQVALCRRAPHAVWKLGSAGERGRKERPWRSPEQRCHFCEGRLSPWGRSALPCAALRHTGLCRS